MSDHWRIFLSFLIVIAFFLAMFDRILPKSVDTMYVNGVFYTLDEDGSVVDAMAIRRDRIAGVGTAPELQDRFKPKQIVDLQGRTVLPGFIDAHAHLMNLALLRTTINLFGVPSELEAAKVVQRRLAEVREGVWIRGRGWDQNLWSGKKFPSKSVLDRVAPNNPVYLERVDGHAAWVNARALELAGITREVQDPPGGRILRDEKGNPSGILIDNAMDLVSLVIPELSESEADEALDLAFKECVMYGITTVHDMGVKWNEIERYKRYADQGTMPIRVYAAVDGTDDSTWSESLGRGPLRGYGGHRLTVRAVKLYVDGALGSRGAALIEPYSDDPSNRGLTLASEDELRQKVRQALETGFQACVHAIGDRGNRIILDVYEAALKELPRKDHRFRVEHAQVLALEDIPRFQKLGVVPSMQPTHCTSDMYWAEARLGPRRIRGAYAWRFLRETGVVIPGGSDFPVEHPNPLYGIYAAMTRKDHRGRPHDADEVARTFQISDAGVVERSVFEDGWYGSQKLTREEAVRSFTSWSAWAAFEEDVKGSLEAGKLADFVVLSDDLMKIEPQEILRTEVEMTVVGGNIVYRKAKAPL
ncbi:MAG: amidohydrolase [Ignavibacteriales bacterium]|nr:amidohydrolase [Ignavibacteriales bacterium]